MSTGLTNGLGPWVVVAFGLAFLIALTATLRAWRESRFSPYYLLRRQAGQRTRARFVLSGGLLAALCLTAVGLSQRPPIELPAITLPAIPLPVLFGVSSTPRPALPTAATATRTATQPPTDTPTLVAPPTRSQPDLPLTVTPARMLPTGFLTPVKALSTPLPDAHFGKIVLASAISGEGYPTVITDTYRTGRFTIYAVFTYTHMSPGVAWGQVWLRGTTPVRGELALWSLKSDGHAYVFINPTEGWLPGDYEVQLYIDRRIEQFAGFRVLP